ncbi:MAG: D-glycerate dehydrogenase [Puia sp.]|nr:D-glycerate dehydrogenase [Puia sp.]
MKKKILVTRTLSLFPDIEDRLSVWFDVEFSRGGKHAPDHFRDALRGKSGVLLGGGERIDEALLSSLGDSALKAVCIPAAGYNNVDIAALTRAGIIVTNAPGLVDETVADFAWGVLLATARRVKEAEDWLQEGEWKESAGSRFFGIDVYGKTLGIIGMGRIGQGIAKRGFGFNARILYNNRHRLPAETEQACRAEYATRDELLAGSDFVILCLPYTPESHHLIGPSEIKKMKKEAILINVARGGLIDEVALADAIREERLAGASLDVFEQEPTVYEGLLGLPNVLLTPHIAGATEASQHAMARLAADNLVAALGYGPDAGRPPSILNPELLEDPAGKGR